MQVVILSSRGSKKVGSVQMKPAPRKGDKVVVEFHAEAKTVKEVVHNYEDKEVRVYLEED